MKDVIEHQKANFSEVSVLGWYLKTLPRQIKAVEIMKASVKDCWIVNSCKTTGHEVVRYVHEDRVCSHRVGVSMIPS